MLVSPSSSTPLLSKVLPVLLSSNNGTLNVTSKVSIGDLSRHSQQPLSPASRCNLMPPIQSHTALVRSAEFERETGLVLWNPKPLRPKPRRKQSAGLGSGLKKRCVFRWLPPFCKKEEMQDAPLQEPAAASTEATNAFRRICRVCIQKRHSIPRSNHGLPASILKPPTSSRRPQAAGCCGATV